MQRRFLVALALLSVACGGASANAPPPEHGHEPGMHHSFADAERWSKEFDAPDRDAWQKPDEVVRLLEIAPGSTVVDLGAGTGYFEPHLSRAVGERGKVIALDVEPSMVEHMKTRVARAGLTNVEPRLVAPDGHDLPRDVDRYLVVDTWHHIDDRSAYAARLAASLRAGGAVVVVDFTKESSHGPPPQHRLAPEETMRELEAGGLKAELATETLPDQYVVIARKR